jgi:hypothetical protein
MIKSKRVFSLFKNKKNFGLRLLNLFKIENNCRCFINERENRIKERKRSTPLNKNLKDFRCETKKIEPKIVLLLFDDAHDHFFFPKI